MHLINRSQLSIKIIMPLFIIFRGRLNWPRINANYKRITKNQPSRTISSQESRQIGKITQSVGWSMDWCWKWPYRILRKGFSLESFLLFEYLKSKNILKKIFEIFWNFVIFETPNSPKSFKFDCIRSREHSSEISCSVTRTCLQMKMNCQKKFNDEEMAARVMMMMQNHALFLR